MYSELNCLKLVRRKSGELVQPALHTSTRWASSMPPISTCAKVVHFGADIEQIRSFFQLDSPISISTESSFVDEADCDCESKLPYDDEHDAERPAFQWKLLAPDALQFPDSCREFPVMLRNLSLTDDQNSVRGIVDVANLAVEKTVVCRFTCDEWKTVSEVSANYCTDTSLAKNILGYDCFIFFIDVSGVADLESTSLSCCIRYAVGDKEFWDNNESSNFRVHFCKHFLYSNMED